MSTEQQLRSESSDTSTGGYDPTAKTLHWLVAALVLVQFIIAFTMPAIRRDTVPGTLINLHLSFGALILAVVLIRALWRRAHPVVPAVDSTPAWQQAAARAVHLLLYVLLLVLPLLGWAAASARDWTIRLFGMVTLPHLVPANAGIGFFAGDAHVVLSWVLLALIGLHVASGFYHYLVMRDRVLQRMLPGG